MKDEKSVFIKRKGEKNSLIFEYNNIEIIIYAKRA